MPPSTELSIACPFEAARISEATQLALRRKFVDEWDLDGNGTLDKDELAALLRRGNPRIKEKDIDLLFQKADLDGNGRICFDEFVSFIFNSSACSDASPMISPSSSVYLSPVSSHHISHGISRGALSPSLSHSGLSSSMLIPSSPGGALSRGISNRSTVKEVRHLLLGDVRAVESLVDRAKDACHLDERQLHLVFEENFNHRRDELGEAEFKALWLQLGFQEHFAAMYFQAFDKDRSGSVAYKELLAGLTILSGKDPRRTAKLLMSVYDTDASGSLSKGELLAAFTNAHTMMKATVASILAPQLGLATGISGLVEAECGEAIETPSLDALMDLVGELPIPGPEEFPRIFGRMDTNQDGTLSEEELAAALRRSEVRKMLLPQMAAKDVHSQLAEGPCCIQ